MGNVTQGAAQLAAQPSTKIQTIYPSIPDPGTSLTTIIPCLTAIKQTLTMIILNSQAPSSTYAPSSAAQTFVTQGQLTALQTQVDTLQKKVG